MKSVIYNNELHYITCSDDLKEVMSSDLYQIIEPFVKETADSKTLKIKLANLQRDYDYMECEYDELESRCEDLESENEKLTNKSQKEYANIIDDYIWRIEMNEESQEDIINKMKQWATSLKKGGPDL